MLLIFKEVVDVVVVFVDVLLILLLLIFAAAAGAKNFFLNKELVEKKRLRVNVFSERCFLRLFCRRFF